MLAASWINDITMPQRESDQRKIFYMNETLLLRQNLRAHFHGKNAKSFYEHGQEFISVKGSCPRKIRATEGRDEHEKKGGVNK